MANIQEEDVKKIDSIDNYLFKETIGQGTFGKVKLGVYLLNQEKVAVKILEKDRIVEKDDEIRVKREFDMLAKLNHPNVILVAEIFESSDSYYGQLKNIKTMCIFFLMMLAASVTISIKTIARNA